MMVWFRLLLLATVLAGTSGFKFRCLIFCIDQTSIQDDYVDARDKCRELAELKQDVVTPGADAADDKAHKAQLVSLFSECMAQKGWSVPDGKNDAKAAAAAAPIPAAPVAVTAPLAATPALSTTSSNADKAMLNRTAECAFARHNAGVSHIASVRAQACDLECAQRLQAAPGAPRPAACSADTTPPPDNEPN